MKPEEMIKEGVKQIINQNNNWSEAMKTRLKSIVDNAKNIRDIVDIAAICETMKDEKI